MPKTSKLKPSPQQPKADTELVIRIESEASIVVKVLFMAGLLFTGDQMQSCVYVIIPLKMMIFLYKNCIKNIWATNVQICIMGLFYRLLGVMHSMKTVKIKYTISIISRGSNELGELIETSKSSCTHLCAFAYQSVFGISKPNEKMSNLLKNKPLLHADSIISDHKLK